MTASVSLPFAYRIARSARRKSACIEVKNGEVILRAPLRFAEASLLAFAASKRAWILAKLAEQADVIAARPPAPVWDTGSLLPYRGGYLRLLVQDGKFNAVVRHADELWLVVSGRGARTRHDKVRALLARWLADEAARVLTPKTHALAAQIGRTVSDVTIRATKSKWGHCTTRGVIQYNWQILLAPEAVVDYLVAHEVSHLIHHDHSPAFWAQVAQLCPDFRALRLWLKQQGAQLVL